MEPFPAPRGVRDFSPSQTAARNHVLGRVRTVFDQYGYREIQTPVFEHFDLFAARSGEEIIESMLTFSVDATRVALRPEMTSAVCRMLVSGKLDTEPAPHKLYYYGPCFRYCRPREGRYREFYQLGVELVGAPGAVSDAETIAMAVNVLEALGISGYRVRVGDVGVVRALLHEGEGDSGLTREDQERVLHDIDRYVHLTERTTTAANDPISSDTKSYFQRERNALVREQPKLGETLKSFDKLDGDELRAALPALAAALEDTLLSQWAGESIIDRNKGEQLLRLSELRGSGEQVWQQAKKATQGTAAEPEMVRLQEVCTLLTSYGVNNFEVDFGVVRNFDFYSGVVFEIDLPQLGENTQVCGGGRYDNLIGEFGGEPTPATGFAFGFERLVSAFEKMEANKDERYGEVCVAVIAGEGEQASAINLAQALRASGVSTLTNFSNADPNAQTEYAKSRNAKAIVVLPDDATSKVCSVTIDGKETTEPLDATKIAALLK